MIYHLNKAELIFYLAFYTSIAGMRGKRKGREMAISELVGI